MFISLAPFFQYELTDTILTAGYNQNTILLILLLRFILSWALGSLLFGPHIPLTYLSHCVLFFFFLSTSLCSGATK